MNGGIGHGQFWLTGLQESHGRAFVVRGRSDNKFSRNISCRQIVVERLTERLLRKVHEIFMSMYLESRHIFFLK